MDQLICAIVVTEIMELILISLVVKVMVSCFSKMIGEKKQGSVFKTRAEE